jgi:hypothetical protein
MRSILFRLPPPPGRCTSAPTTIKVKACRLEQDKVCTTELKVVGDKVSYEKGECKQVEVCKPLAYFVPRTGYGKRNKGRGSYCSRPSAGGVFVANKGKQRYF